MHLDHHIGVHLDHESALACLECRIRESAVKCECTTVKSG